MRPASSIVLWLTVAALALAANVLGRTVGAELLAAADPLWWWLGVGASSGTMVVALCATAVALRSLIGNVTLWWLLSLVTLVLAAIVLLGMRFEPLDTREGWLAAAGATMVVVIHGTALGMTLWAIHDDLGRCYA